MQRRVAAFSHIVDENLAPSQAKHGSVADELVRIVAEHGGELGGQKLPLLYNAHPNGQSEIVAAGGLKKFCAKHSSRLRFTSDGGPGRVVLCSVGAAGAAGVPGAAGVTRSAGSTGAVGVTGAAGAAGAAAAAAGGGGGREAGTVLEALVRLVQAQGGEMLPARMSMLYQQHPQAQEEVRRAGGVKTFCARYPSRLRWLQGKIALADLPPQRPPPPSSPLQAPAELRGDGGGVIQGGSTIIQGGRKGGAVAASVPMVSNGSSSSGLEPGSTSLLGAGPVQLYQDCSV
eukprot:3452219-Rhodomonas_salina.1